MPYIYRFTSYREFLLEYYREKKSRVKSFSYQVFAQKAKIGSSGFLLHVIKGERNLTKTVLIKVAQAMGLDRMETEYFEDLVSYDQAKTQAEKNFYYGKMMAARQSVQVRSLDDYQYAFYSEWYHSVIRELVPMLPKGHASAAIGKCVVPGITGTQVKKSLVLLEKLGILKLDVAGQYVQSEAFISGTGAPSRKVAITKFQQAMLGIASQAWDNFPENEISMLTSTLSVSQETAANIRAEIRDFNKKLLSLAKADSKPSDQVFHLNMNFFPITKNIPRTEV